MLPWLVPCEFFGRTLYAIVDDDRMLVGWLSAVEVREALWRLGMRVGSPPASPRPCV